MTALLFWLAQYALVIYLVCLMGAIGYASVALAARRRLNAAQFSLEREITQQQLSRAWVMTALFVLLGGVVFTVSAFVTPNLPDMPYGTPTANVGLTPIPTPTGTLPPTLEVTATLTATEELPIGEPPDEATTPEPTPTLTPEPTPVPPDAYQPDCPSPNAQIIGPTAGSTVWGNVEIRGTAAINAFAYYKFEIIFPNSQTPNFIIQHDIPVENGILGVWDVSDAGLYPPGGPYRFRLVVVDIYGNTATCIVPLNITQD